MPFRRILIPVDFAQATDDVVHSGLSMRIGDVEVEVAPASVKALELARELQNEDTRLRVVHATPPLEHGAVYSGSGGLGLMGSAIEEIHSAAKKASLEVLEAIVTKLCPGAKVEYAAEAGVPLSVILDEARGLRHRSHHHGCKRPQPGLSLLSRQHGGSSHP